MLLSICVRVFQTCACGKSSSATVERVSCTCACGERTSTFCRTVFRHTLVASCTSTVSFEDCSDMRLQSNLRFLERSKSVLNERMTSPETLCSLVQNHQSGSNHAHIRLVNFDELLFLTVLDRSNWAVCLPQSWKRFDVLSQIGSTSEVPPRSPAKQGTSHMRL